MWRRFHALNRFLLPILLGAFCLGGVCLYYYWYVSEQADYLTRRNLRLLDTVGGYIETSMASDASTLQSFLQLPPDEFAATAREAVNYIPVLKLLETADQRTADQAIEHRAQMAAFYLYDTPTETAWIVTRDNAHRPADWTAAGSSDRAQESSGAANVAKHPLYRINLDRVLGPIFSEQVPTGVFDSVLLTTTDGKVLYQHAGNELQIRNLDSLVLEPANRRNADEKTKESNDLAKLAGSTNVLRTTIAGVPYRVFVQPCCRSVRSFVHAENESGWLIAGITAETKVSYRSLALSSSMLVPLVLIVAALVFSWPFLKFVLVGTRERLRLLDVAVLGLCAFMGTSLVTVLCLDLYAARGLDDEIDEQLVQFSNQLRTNFENETTAARDQLKTLEANSTDWDEYRAWLEQRPLPSTTDSPYEHLLTRGASENWAYPSFEWFFLVDRNGWQALKWAAGSFLTPKVSVAERDYVKHWASHDPGDRDPYYLQSVRSMTTGRKQAVLSRQTAQPQLKVAGLTIPMISLVDPVVVSRFGFAVIDDNGAVLFHSDQRHNLEERFFMETDLNRRLRAAVAARRAETMDVRYWGGEYRAHIAPLALDAPGAPAWLVPWSVVTFYEKAAARTVHVERLVTSLVFLVFYVTLFAMPIAIVLVLRRGYVVPWLWPDRRRVREYRAVAIAGFLYGASLTGATLTLRDVHLLTTVILVPVLMWILVYVVLARQDPERNVRSHVATAVAAITAVAAVAALLEQWDWKHLLPATGVIVASLLLVGERFRKTPRSAHLHWPSVGRPYTLAASVLLVTSAVLPACGFFRLAHDLQMEAFIKSRQLRTVKALHERDQRVAQFSSRQAGLNQKLRRLIRDQHIGLGDYSSVFFDTTQVPDAPGECRLGTPEAGFHESLGDGLPKFLEATLPYISDESVEMREFLHNVSSGDGAWDWHRTPRALTLHIARDPEGRTMNVQTTLPRVLDRWSDDNRAEQIIYFLFIPVIIIGTVWGAVRFIARRVFLVDLKNPPWLTVPSESVDVAIAAKLADEYRPSRALAENERRWSVPPARHERNWRMLRILRNELAHPAVRKVWDDLAPPGGWMSAAADPDFDLDQLMDHVAERLSGEYGRHWNLCSSDEKVVLGQLAAEGIVNGTAHLTVQKLMARGLLRRAPNFVVWNETFRRFIRGQERRQEVLGAEHDRTASTWDRIRWPLLAVIGLGAIFFVTTQQALFDWTVSLVAGLIGGLPAILHLVGSIGHRHTAAAFSKPV